MRKALISAISLLIFAKLAHGSVGGYITEADRNKFFPIFTQSFDPSDKDYTNSYYGAKGLTIINQPVVLVVRNQNCPHIKSHFKPEDSPEIVFQALSAWKYLKCEGALPKDPTVKNLLKVLEDEKSTVQEIRYAAEALKLLGQNIPNAQKIAQLVQARLKEDDSLQNLGQAFHLAAILGPAGKFAQDRVEEVVVQADEVDGKLLQWEGGLTTTSLLITGLLKVNPAKALSPDQADKLANYLLSRKTVQSYKGLLALVEAVEALAQSPVSPVTISIIGPAQVTIDKPDLKIHISDLLGAPLKSPPSPVIAQSATRITDDVVVLSKQALKAGASPVEFILPLKLEPGQYKIVLTAGTQSTTLTVRVLGPVNLEYLEVGLSDADGSSTPKLTKLTYKSKLSQNLQADSSQHLVVKFPLSRKIHQAFVRLFTPKREIIFVAEPDSYKIYKVDVSLANELTYSGKYEIELILGDAVMSNPLRWVLGGIEVKLGAEEPAKTSSRGPKPEIQHLFRPAEKRPAEIVSLSFTALTLSPLVLLLVLWWRIGVNFNNFTVLSVPFFAGFGGILGLFTLFWLKLDMFTTCAWLIPIGGFTFLAGHKLLSQIAKHKKL